MSRAPVRKALDVATLFSHRYESSPKPINCTTFMATGLIASDVRHPLFIPVTRRLKSWNPARLHWAVRAPMSLSKKRTIRSWLTKRVRTAFTDELKSRGLDQQGEAVAGSSNPQSSIKGALSITIRQPVLTAPIGDVRQSCKLLLDKIATGNKPKLQSSQKAPRNKR